VLISESTGRRYVGQTEDLDRRICEHNSKIHNPRKFTFRNSGPWRLLHKEEFATRAAAMAREKWLKSEPVARGSTFSIERVRRRRINR
jgi:putative endonuclease